MGDTAGPLGYYRLRPLSYVGARCFLITFSVVSSSSLKNVVSKWIPEIEAHRGKNGAHDGVIILVGTKIDLRNDEEMKKKLKSQDRFIITKEQGMRAAKKMGVAGYYETSAKTCEGVLKLFG